MAYAIGTLPDGRIKYTDGTAKIPGSSATDPNYANYQPTYQTPVDQPYVPTQEPIHHQTATNDDSSGTNTPSGPRDSRLDQLEKMDRNPKQDEEYRSLLEAANTGPTQQEIDDAYNPMFNYLNEAESNLRADYPVAQQEINAQADLNNQQLTADFDKTNQGIETARQRGRSRKEDAVSAARRLFQELGIGNVQRFGGSTSAGQAASELQGREFQRSQARENLNFNELSQELDNKKIEVENQYMVRKQENEVRRQSEMNEAQRSLQEKLLEITRLKSETEAAKAQMRLSALEQYRQQVFNIKLQNHQFNQQIEGMRQSAMIELDLYQRQNVAALSGANTGVNAYVNSTNTNPQSQFAIGGGTVGQTLNTPYVGQITPRRDDENAYAPGKDLFSTMGSGLR